MSRPEPDPTLAIRYGHVCRQVFGDCAWEDCEEQVRRHWALIDDLDWTRARPWVLQGWRAVIGKAGG
jgi:hypothetical protein